MFSSCFQKATTSLPTFWSSAEGASLLKTPSLSLTKPPGKVTSTSCVAPVARFVPSMVRVV